MCLRKISLYLFQVEHLEVPSSQDKIFVFLHRGAMVGGKEVNNYVHKKEVPGMIFSGFSPHAMESVLYGCPLGISLHLECGCLMIPSQTLLEF